MINKVTIIGNVGMDPELRMLDNGNSVTKVSVATNENWRDKNGEWKTDTTWHNVEIWGKYGESFNEKIYKGNQVYIEGKIKNSRYENADGKTVYKSVIVAKTWRQLERRPTEEMAY